MSNANALPPRSEIPVEQTWDLTNIYASNEDWQSAYDLIEADIPKLAAFQGRLAEGPKVLGDFFEASEQVYREIGKVFVYASLQGATDALDQTATARMGQAMGLMTRVRAATSFDDPEMIAIGFDALAAWRELDERLTETEHFVDRLQRQVPHKRSSDVEEILASVSDPIGQSRSIYGSLTNADLDFKPARDKQGGKHPISQSTISALKTSPDRKLRKTAWRHYADGYLGMKNTLSATLTSAVKRDVFYMQARSHESSLAASLHGNKIPLEVFHNLIDVFKDNISTWHRYWAIRRKALGYKKLHVYDIKAPLTANPPVVPYTQSVEWIAEGMRPLGNDYVEAMRRGCLEERWVDWSINKGKRAGAFSSGWHDTNPFIMMSYSDDLFSLSTLAHELGHSMHSYYSRRAQPFLYSRYSLFVAEVASNFNQAMTRAHLFETQSDPDFRIALIEEAMSNFHRYFFVMPTLARFELEMHTRAEKGQPINADILIGLMADLFTEGYGDEVDIDRERIGITWAQFGHLYANFYVYMYATGISGAHSLAQGILDGQSGAADRYLDFLKAGGSVYPLDALKMAGVDMTSREPVETTFGVLSGLVDQLDSLLS
jgi:oligoendopeptidase F